MILLKKIVITLISAGLIAAAVYLMVISYQAKGRDSFHFLPMKKFLHHSSRVRKSPAPSLSRRPILQEFSSRRHHPIRKSRLAEATQAREDCWNPAGPGWKS